MNKLIFEKGPYASQHNITTKNRRQCDEHKLIPSQPYWDADRQQLDQLENTIYVTECNHDTKNPAVVNIICILNGQVVNEPASTDAVLIPLLKDRQVRTLLADKYGVLHSEPLAYVISETGIFIGTSCSNTVLSHLRNLPTIGNSRLFNQIKSVTDFNRMEIALALGLPFPLEEPLVYSP